MASGARPEEARRASIGLGPQAPTWSDIARAAEAKKFSYGMTDPSASNSGFSALVGVVTALSGGGAAPNAQRATAVAPDLRRFLSAQTMTSGSSGWLVDQFVDKAVKPGHPDGIVNYVLGLNAEGKLMDSLSVVVPSDGVVTANPREARTVPLKGLATLTGGELIEAEGNSLAKAFKEIRTYQ